MDVRPRYVAATLGTKTYRARALAKKGDGGGTTPAGAAAAETTTDAAPLTSILQVVNSAARTAETERVRLSECLRAENARAADLAAARLIDEARAGRARTSAARKAAKLAARKSRSQMPAARAQTAAAQTSADAAGPSAAAASVYKVFRGAGLRHNERFVLFSFLCGQGPSEAFFACANEPLTASEIAVGIPLVWAILMWFYFSYLRGPAPAHSRQTAAAGWCHAAP